MNQHVDNWKGCLHTTLTYIDIYLHIHVSTHTYLHKLIYKYIHPPSWIETYLHAYRYLNTLILLYSFTSHIETYIHTPKTWKCTSTNICLHRNLVKHTFLHIYVRTHTSNHIYYVQTTSDALRAVGSINFTSNVSINPFQSVSMKYSYGTCPPLV